MGIGKISEQYRTQSPDDQATFNRWVGANVVIGSIIAIGLIAMAVAGSRSGPPQEVEWPASRSLPPIFPERLPYESKLVPRPGFGWPP
jgi:hypothetical protein